MTIWSSPLLEAPGAVEDSGADAGVAAHYGDPLREQRSLLAGRGLVDLSHLGVIRVSGPDRLSWLHSLTTQHLLDLTASTWTSTLVLSPAGHVEYAMRGYDDGAAWWACVEPKQTASLVGWLDAMRFMLRVVVEDVTQEWATIARGPQSYALVPRADLRSAAGDSGLCGTWAYEALRIARGEPRIGHETDHKTIPNEVGWIGSAVHLDKGCYRGQETVARVHTLGRPPRRLVMLHLDGSVDTLPAHGDPVIDQASGREIGFVGSAARHFELGPIGLALVKRNVPVDSALLAGGIAAAQEVVVDPEAGLHVRARL